ncbi:hypothetical protein KJ673_02535 [Patescibacteria group bacterium]|nr:hypothetical protein [Patescibacteria group bacterium]MBU4453335.1 hypothetical protein [Patescibacteria group bacterium]MCG2687747.1 hypothetical protein [Candidatus Parcubacteria bacterium]
MSIQESGQDAFNNWFDPTPEMPSVSRPEMMEILGGSADAVVRRLKSIESVGERDRVIIEMVTDIGTATHNLCILIDALRDFQDPRTEDLIRNVIGNINKLTVLQDAILDMFENSESLPELSLDDAE